MSANDADGDATMVDAEKVEGSTNGDAEKAAAEQDKTSTGEAEAGAEAEAETKAEAPKEEEEEPILIVSRCEAIKADGNALLKNGDLAQALEKYQEGEKAVGPLLEKIPGENISVEEQQAACQLYIALGNNGAQAAIKLEVFDVAIDLCDKVLKADNKNLKALFRRGIARSQFPGRLDDAKDDFAEVIKLDPNNREARNELAKVKQALKEKREQEKAAYSQAMQGGLYKENHRKLQMQEEQWQTECERRKEAGEDEISFEDWRKKQEDDKKAADKKKEEALKEKQKKEREAQEEGGQEQRRASEVMQVGEDDLDEEDKKLLEETKKKGYYHGRLHHVPSNAAPTPQNVTDAPQRIRDVSPSAGSGSAWNAAGTWEDKDQSDWVKIGLQDRLKAAAVKQDGIEAKVRSVSKCEGEASIAVVRGTKRYLYDLKATIEWKVLIPNEDESEKPLEYKGKFNMPEISDAVPCDQLQCLIEWTSRRPGDSSKAELVDAWLAKLQGELRTQVALFVMDYQNR